MAAKYITLLLILLIIKYAVTKTRRVFIAISNLNNAAKDIKTHLDNPKVKLFCANRDVHCRSNDSKVCALRALNSTFSYKEFNNACYLFLSNMCDQPGEEFHIVGTGSCDHYLNIQRRNQDSAKPFSEPENMNNSSENGSNNNENINYSVENVNKSTDKANVNNANLNKAGTAINSHENINNSVENYSNNIENGTNDVGNVNNRREIGNNSLENDARSNENSTNADNSSENITKNTENENNNHQNENNNSEKRLKNITKIFRKGKKSLRTYDTAYDNHICPKACPETYSPVCVNVNRGYGKYFKMFTFLNHCKADFYYCNNTSEFDPPPDESAEMVDGSNLSWSYCAASRYLQFARFAEVTSSMGHYGWLSGNYGYSHIMEPHERMPGHG